MILENFVKEVHWKWHKPGSVINVSQRKDGSFYISQWTLTDGTPEPSEKQILAAMEEYNDRSREEKETKQSRLTQLLLKPDISAIELREMLLLKGIL